MVDYAAKQEDARRSRNCRASLVELSECRRFQGGQESRSTTQDYNSHAQHGLAEGAGQGLSLCRVLKDHREGVNVVYGT